MLCTCSQMKKQSSKMAQKLFSKVLFSALAPFSRSRWHTFLLINTKWIMKLFCDIPGTQTNRNRQGDRICTHRKKSGITVPGITITVAAVAAANEQSQNFTQHRIAISTRNRKRPRKSRKNMMKLVQVLILLLSFFSN